MSLITEFLVLLAILSTENRETKLTHLVEEDEFFNLNQ